MTEPQKKPERTYGYFESKGGATAPDHGRIARSLSTEEIEIELDRLGDLWPNDPAMRKGYEEALRTELDRRSATR